MSRILIFLAFSMLFSSLSAQTPLSEAVDFTVTTTHGEEISLFDFLNDDKIVMIDFFSTTCGSCNYWAPHFQPAYEAFGCGNGNVVFLGIERFHDDAATIAFDEQYGIEFPSASGSEGGGEDVFSLYQVQATPTLVVITPDRTIVQNQITNPSTEKIIEKVEEAGGVQMECVTGINKNYSEGNIITISPNPVSDQANILFQLENSGDFSIEVIEISGKIVKQNHMGNLGAGVHEIEINLNSFSQGYYLIALKRNNTVISMNKISVIH